MERLEFINMILGFFIIIINGSLFKNDVTFICVNAHRVNVIVYVKVANLNIRSLVIPV